MPPRPVLVKLAPDLAPAIRWTRPSTWRAERGLAGVIVSNTTLSRDGLVSPPALTAREGGLSGAPLRERATDDGAARGATRAAAT